MAERLFHFSDRGDIEVFVPRAPLRHPDAEPLVYAIDDWHSPLYLFPRDCPRIVVWPTAETEPEDLAWFEAQTSARLLGFIQQDQEADWRSASLFRYAFAPSEFEDTGDIGVWVSRKDIVPLGQEQLKDLPFLAGEAGLQVEIVDSLIDKARELFDFDLGQFKTSLHVSMIRISALPNWPIPPSKPPWLDPNRSG